MTTPSKAPNADFEQIPTCHGKWGDDETEVAHPITSCSVSYAAIVVAGKDATEQRNVEERMKRGKAEIERKEEERIAQEKLKLERQHALEETRRQEEEKEKARCVAQMKACESVTCPRCGNTKSPMFAMCSQCFTKEKKCPKCHGSKNPYATFCPTCVSAEQVCPTCGEMKSIHHPTCFRCAYAKTHTCPKCGGHKAEEYPMCFECSKKKRRDPSTQH
jgi:hypothetical protein